MDYTNAEYLAKMKHANNCLGINDDLSILKNNNIIFIYSLPKVGSTTLVSSIRITAAGKYTVLHLHNELMLKVLYNLTDVTVLEIIKYNAYLGKKVFVIDIYRSPIELKMSTFFENISTFHFNCTNEILGQINMDKLINRFNKLFPHIKTTDYYQKKYEIRNIPAFDFQKKYIQVSQDGVEYIKLRLKDSGEWSSILARIFGISFFIVKDYETSKKPIHAIYSAFYANYKIPQNLFDCIEKSENLQLYYSDEERKTYFNVWRNKVSNCVEPYSFVEYKLYNSITNDNQHFSEIQQDHYIDAGCLCDGCCRKRGLIIMKIQKGDQNIERIDHTAASEEYLKIMVKKLPIKMIPFIKKKKHVVFGKLY